MAEEPPEQFNAQILYREWGRRFTFLQKYLKGIHYYEKSTEFGDENYLWTLLGLSVALKKSGQFKEAAEAAEKCMEIDPTHLDAYGTRMEALYVVAQFGASLVLAHQGARRRKHFRAAVLLANETIEDCIGANVPPDMLRQLQPWIAELVEHRKILEQQMKAEEDEFAGIGEEQSRFKVDDMYSQLQRYRKRIDRMTAEIYLGNSSHDKYFLESLTTDPAVYSANKEGSAKLAAAAEESLSRVHRQQEALRNRKPIYAVLARRRAAVTESHQITQYQELDFQRCLIENAAKFILEQLHEARLLRDYPTFFKRVERAKERFEAYSRRLFPAKLKYLDALYCMVSRAYLDPRNLQRYRDCNIRLLYMRRLLGLRGPRLPRDSDLAWAPTLNIKQAFERCRDRLALASRPLEILWIYHELCKLFLQTRRYEMARFYAKKTLDLSERTGHEDWALNANHIILRIELIQHNRNEAREAATDALTSARKLKVDFLIDFYERVVNYVDKIDFGRLSDDDSIVKRQRLMIGLMPPDLVANMELLLRSMESVPARRRLSVMPGCKTKDRKQGPVPSKPTVMPGPPKDFETVLRDELLKKFSPSKKILGYVDFEDYD